MRPMAGSLQSSVGAGATALLLGLMAACATNPATGQHEFSLMSEQKEIAVGQAQDAQIRKEMGVYADRDLQEYVNDIGLRLAQSSERANLPWHYTVVDSPAINAFALPGGYIYITRGILPFLADEAQLAGVLGHETGHVTARHAAQQYTRSAGAELGFVLGSIFVPAARPLAGIGESGLGVLFLKYGRDDEAQADALGVRYASRAGWDPDAIPQMLTTLGRIEETSDSKGTPNWLQTHPVAEDRVSRVQAAVRDAEAGATRFTTERDVFLKHIDGVVYGDSPEQGVVRGHSYLHTGLRFALDFPEGWDVNNGEAAVVAKQPGATASIILQPVQRLPARDVRNIEDIATRSMAAAGLRAVSGSRTTIHGLDVFVGTYQGALQSTGRVTIRAAHVALDQDVYLLAGIASPDSYDSLEPTFTRTIESFRSMTRGEAEGIRPNHVSLYTARAGDTWQSIADRTGNGVVKSSTLAIMNGHAVNDEPRAGERLKIVVAG
jgi:predicted Zn-dependent protease